MKKKSSPLSLFLFTEEEGKGRITTNQKKKEKKKKRRKEEEGKAIQQVILNIYRVSIK
jgi:hypothetical protein